MQTTATISLKSDDKIKFDEFCKQHSIKLSHLVADSIHFYIKNKFSKNEESLDDNTKTIDAGS